MPGNVGEPRWVQWEEYRDYANQVDGREDIGNRSQQDFYATFTVQHDYATGAHAGAGMLVFEQEKYIGNGVDPQNVSLTNANLDIYFLLIWRADSEYPVFYSEDMSADNTKELETNAFQADMIQSVGVGTFQVGGDAAVNENLITYYYLAVGVE
jgi:hypothetical protein